MHSHSRSCQKSLYYEALKKFWGENFCKLFSFSFWSGFDALVSNKRWKGGLRKENVFSMSPNRFITSGKFRVLNISCWFVAATNNGQFLGLSHKLLLKAENRKYIIVVIWAQQKGVLLLLDIIISFTNSSNSFYACVVLLERRTVLNYKNL